MKSIIALIFTFATTLFLHADVKHKFVCVDNGKGQLVFVDQFDNVNSWKVKLAKGSRDIFLLDSNRVLLSTSSGAQVHSLKDGSVISSIKGIKGSQTASLTKNGSILLANNKELAFYTQEGELIKKISIKPVGHNRLARQLKNGNVVYAANSYELLEFDKTGKVVWKHKMAEKSYIVHEEADGSLLATRGHGLDVVRINRDGKETLICGGKENHPNAVFAWFSGFHVLPNENIAVANWCGHGFKGKKVHAYEFDRENNIVWSWEDPTVKQVTTIQIVK